MTENNFIERAKKHMEKREFYEALCLLKRNMYQMDDSGYYLLGVINYGLGRNAAALLYLDKSSLECSRMLKDIICAKFPIYRKTK